METAALPPYDHSITYPRLYPPLTHMPTMRRAIRGPKTGGSPSTQQALSPQAGCEPIVLRYEKHQDIIPVKSVESEENRRQLTGVKHYLHMMSQLGLNAKPSLDHIDYRNLGGATSATDPVEDHTSPHIPPTSLTTPTLPSPPSSLPDYNEPIYSGTTPNPAVFLSILRIAQHNFPSLDLSSALNHLPNMHASDTLPRLHPSAPGNLAPRPFIDASSAPRRANDANLHIAFLPSFYADARHCIGYFEILRSSRGTRKVGTCLFAPCTEEELRRFGLVEYLQGGEDDGVEGMRRVGAGKGYWLDKDAVEEYEEWSLTWKVAQRVWEGRLRYARGALEA